jgi:hypothetical protein
MLYCNCLHVQDQENVKGNFNVCLRFSACNINMYVHVGRVAISNGFSWLANNQHPAFTDFVVYKMQNLAPLEERKIYQLGRSSFGILKFFFVV